MVKAGKFTMGEWICGSCQAKHKINDHKLACSECKTYNPYFALKRPELLTVKNHAFKVLINLLSTMR
jgi:hypothetical protein